MPSKSKPQAKLMAGVANNPKFAKKVGIPQKVGKEFNKADAKTGILKKSSLPDYITKPPVMKKNKPAPMLGARKD